MGFFNVEKNYLKCRDFKINVNLDIHSNLLHLVEWVLCISCMQQQWRLLDKSSWTILKYMFFLGIESAYSQHLISFTFFLKLKKKKILKTTTSLTKLNGFIRNILFKLFFSTQDPNWVLRSNIRVLSWNATNVVYLIWTFSRNLTSVTSHYNFKMVLFLNYCLAQISRWCIFLFHRWSLV